MYKYLQQQHFITRFKRQYIVFMKGLFMVMLMLTAAVSFAQPVFDVVNLRYQRSPRGKSSPAPNQFTYLNASINIPLILKKDSSIIVFSPFIENWSIKAPLFSALSMIVHSVALPVSMVKPLNRSWAISLSAIPRWNGNAAVDVKRFQMGGALLATYKKRPGLEYKFGLYYNSEFSGPFFMPLLGIDWQIDKKNNLFGVLPGNLVYEHRLSHDMYWGAAFRSITNSYANGYNYSDQTPTFLRIQDTQAEIYTDLYLTDNIVLNIAAGHSFARKFREGRMHVFGEYFHDQNMDAGFYGKISFAYRIRFR